MVGLSDGGGMFTDGSYDAFAFSQLRATARGYRPDGHKDGMSMRDATGRYVWKRKRKLIFGRRWETGEGGRERGEGGCERGWAAEAGSRKTVKIGGGRGG